MHDMKPIRQTMAAALLAACCATTFAAGQAGASRQDGAPPADQGPGGGPCMDGPMGRGPDGGPARGQGFGGPRGHDAGHGGGLGLGHLGGLRLSEAQQDKLFAIEHAAAPQRRQQEKTVRRAHEALRALRDAAQFDEARAAAASRELGQAIAAEALLQARLHAQAMAVLTPEQREQLCQRRAQPSP
jgi:Spy/CpxP family protein refolding chaperone